MAQRLADAKVGRVSVSIDSFDEKTHDEFRGKRGALKHALEAHQNRLPLPAPPPYQHLRTLTAFQARQVQTPLYLPCRSGCFCGHLHGFFASLI